MPLRRESNLQDRDALYADIIDAHAGLSFEDSAALNARLVLLLANHIGDRDIVREALTTARTSLHRNPKIDQC
jgi:hypothetical protein